MELLQFLIKQLLTVIFEGLLGISGHSRDPIVHSPRNSFNLVVMGKRSSVYGEACHLIEEGLEEPAIVAKLQVLLDDLSIYHETMLLEDGVKGVDDPDFFLVVVVYFFDLAGMNLVEMRLEEFNEHAITEVLFDNDVVDLPSYRCHTKSLHRGFAVAFNEAPQRQSGTAFHEGVSPRHSSCRPSLGLKGQ